MRFVLSHCWLGAPFVSCILFRTPSISLHFQFSHRLQFPLGVVVHLSLPVFISGHAGVTLCSSYYCFCDQICCWVKWRRYSGHTCGSAESLRCLVQWHPWPLMPVEGVFDCSTPRNNRARCGCLRFVSCVCVCMRVLRAAFLPM